jgi:hypothetical protein
MSVGQITSTPPHYVSEAATALSATYAVMTLDGAHGGTALPTKGAFLDTLVGAVDTIASSAATITWKLTSDVAGDRPITAETTWTILVGETTATSGSVVSQPGQWFIPKVAGTVYLWAKTDTGTCNLTPELTWVT